MSDRIPPHSREAEEAVLGSMMMTSEAMATVISRTTRSEVFYFDIHRWIFQAMLELFIDGTPVDQITVSDKLKKHENLEKVGGSYYITGLLDSTPASSNVGFHLNIIIQKWGLRRLITDGVTNTMDAYADTATVEDLLEGSEKRLLDLWDELKGDAQIVLIGDVVDEVAENVEKGIEKAKEKGVFGLTTGFVTLDRITYGLEAEYTIIAGRPSMGKTALAFGIAYNVAKIEEVNVYLISLEMTRDAAIERMGYALGKTSRNMRLKEAKDEEREKMISGWEKLKKVKIWIDEISSLNTIELRSRVKQQIIKNDIRLVIIDYIQLMEAGTPKERKMDRGRQEEMREISKAIANLKKETGLPFLILSQLNRDVEKRKDKRPILADLRETGAIEQDADKVILMYREDAYRSYSERKALIDAGKEVLTQECLAIIAKNRSGPTGTASLKFIKELAKFENWEYEELKKLYGFHGIDMPDDEPRF